MEIFPKTFYHRYNNIFFENHLLFMLRAFQFFYHLASVSKFVVFCLYCPMRTFTFELFYVILLWLTISHIFWPKHLACYFDTVFSLSKPPCCPFEPGRTLCFIIILQLIPDISIQPNIFQYGSLSSLSMLQFIQCIFSTENMFTLCNTYRISPNKRPDRNHQDIHRSTECRMRVLCFLMHTEHVYVYKTCENVYSLRLQPIAQSPSLVNLCLGK